MGFVRNGPLLRHLKSSSVVMLERMWVQVCYSSVTLSESLPLSWPWFSLPSHWWGCKADLMRCSMVERLAQPYEGLIRVGSLISTPQFSPGQPDHGRPMKGKTLSFRMWYFIWPAAGWMCRRWPEGGASLHWMELRTALDSCRKGQPHPSPLTFAGFESQTSLSCISGMNHTRDHIQGGHATVRKQGWAQF